MNEAKIYLVTYVVSATKTYRVSAKSLAEAREKICVGEGEFMVANIDGMVPSDEDDICEVSILGMNKNGM